MLDNYELGVQTQKDFDYNLANSAKGQHIHLIVNNGPYSAKYSPEFEHELDEGNNVILAFLSRSYHESVKNPSAYYLAQVGDGQKLDLTQELLFYSRPKGVYKGEDTDRVLLDFYLINTSISADGNKVRATIHGKEFLIDKVGIVEKQAKMRSQQMFNAIYKKNIKSFDELTTFSLELREKIKDLISLEKSAKIIEVQKSKSDGTIKFLLELKKDKRQTETVLIPDKSKSKYTICLSVSVGCFLNCQFCATAQIPKKLVRNLSASEIMSQIMLCKEYLNDWKTSNKLVKTQVLMGSGDFALNAENVRTYIQNAKHKDSLDYGRTRITVSSVGLGNKIKDLSVIEWAARELDVYFAWSLHNPINKQRLEMMPNGNYSIDDLIPSS